MTASFKPETGAYPTMITPYNKDGSIDLGAVTALTDWYYEQGCNGIFASCQSSEIHFLELSERVSLARVVKEEVDRISKGGRKMTVVASGHISGSQSDQENELRLTADTGVDAVILISNRLDIANSSDETWISELSQLIDRLPDIPLGIYECPRPYKRLLTPKMIDFIVKSGRFAFIKDTCCDANEIDRRIKQINSTPSDGLKPFLFNANAQTLLDSLRSGGAGYCGVMCNFHPALYVRLCRDFESADSELLADLLSQSAFIEYLTYPAIAKYHLNKLGIKMETLSRSCDHTKMGAYDRLCVDRMDRLAEYFDELYR